MNTYCHVCLCRFTHPAAVWVELCPCANDLRFILGLNVFKMNLALAG